MTETTTNDPDTSISIVNALLAPILMNKTNLSKIGRSDDLTKLAWIIVILNSISAAIIGWNDISVSFYFEKISDLSTTSWGIFILLSTVISILIYSTGIYLILTTYDNASGFELVGIFRIYGFLAFWNLIANIILIITEDEDLGFLLISIASLLVFIIVIMTISEYAHITTRTSIKIVIKGSILSVFLSFIAGFILGLFFILFA